MKNSKNDPLKKEKARQKIEAKIQARANRQALRYVKRKERVRRKGFSVKRRNGKQVIVLSCVATICMIATVMTVVALIPVFCAHKWSGGVCEICKAHCKHTWQQGVCAECEIACTHGAEDFSYGGFIWTISDTTHTKTYNCCNAVVTEDHAWNSENTCTDCIYYKDPGVVFILNGSEYSVMGYKGTSASVIIPSTYKGFPVTSIGDSAFYNCGNLVSITIPNSVTSIGADAFFKCLSLTSIEIPASVTSIGDNAFKWCENLTSVTFAEGSKLTSIGTSAFYNCGKLESIAIPNGVTSIGASAFFDCIALTSVVLPEGIETIEYHVFFQCASLADINIPVSVTSIGIEAFSRCRDLSNITIPNGVSNIGVNAFRGCDSLTSVTFENPNGWWYYEESLKDKKTISLASVATPLAAATSLTSTYSDYYWNRCQST